MRSFSPNTKHIPDTQSQLKRVAPFPTESNTTSGYIFPSSTFHHQTTALFMTSPLCTPLRRVGAGKEHWGKGNGTGPFTQFSRGYRKVPFTYFMFLLSDSRSATEPDEIHLPKEKSSRSKSCPRSTDSRCHQAKRSNTISCRCRFSRPVEA